MDFKLDCLGMYWIHLDQQLALLTQEWNFVINKITIRQAETLLAAEEALRLIELG